MKRFLSTGLVAFALAAFVSPALAEQPAPRPEATLAPTTVEPAQPTTEVNAANPVESEVAVPTQVAQPMAETTQPVLSERDRIVQMYQTQRIIPAP
jgi:hypothetical protein